MFRLFDTDNLVYSELCYKKFIINKADFSGEDQQITLRFSINCVEVTEFSAKDNLNTSNLVELGIN